MGVALRSTAPAAVPGAGEPVDDSRGRAVLLGPVLDGLGQIPIRRGSGDSGALGRRWSRCCAGDALGVFPEGRLTWGVPIRARSGVGLLAAWCPDARIVLCTIEGTTDYVRFPKRPKVRRAVLPAVGRAGAGRAKTRPPWRRGCWPTCAPCVPPTPAGRRGTIGGPPRIQRLLARNQPD